MGDRMGEMFLDSNNTSMVNPSEFLGNNMAAQYQRMYD